MRVPLRDVGGRLAEVARVPRELLGIGTAEEDVLQLPVVPWNALRSCAASGTRVCWCETSVTACVVALRRSQG